MDTYGLPNPERTEIIEQRRADSKKWLNVPGIDGPVINPTHDQYLLAGWVKYVTPIFTEYERRGPVSIGDITYTHLVDPWTDSEIRIKKTAETKITADNKVDILIPNGNKDRWETRSLRLIYKRQKHLKNPVEPDLNAEEEALADQLDTLGDQTEQIREAQDEIKADIANASGQSLKDIDTSVNNPRWPT